MMPTVDVAPEQSRWPCQAWPTSWELTDLTRMNPELNNLLVKGELIKINLPVKFVRVSCNLQIESISFLNSMEISLTENDLAAM